MRLACRTEDEASQIRPRRAALLPRVALALGVCLIALTLVLAARTMLTAPTGQEAPLGRRAQSPVPTSSLAPGDQDLVPVDPASPDSGPAQVVVHVAGAVAVPGVVVLRPGARVADAIDAAGGPAADADTDQLNLARPLADGEQVRVPRAGRTPQPGRSNLPAAGAGRLPQGRLTGSQHTRRGRRLAASSTSTPLTPPRLRTCPASDRRWPSASSVTASPTGPSPRLRTSSTSRASARPSSRRCGTGPRYDGAAV